MLSRFSFCLTILFLALLSAAPDGLAVVPPRPGSNAVLPDVALELKQQGFGRVSRPAISPLAVEPASGLKHGSAGKAALVGTRYLPVLMGETVDRLGTHAPASLEAQLFGSWPTGSMSDYYAQVSYGQFQLTGSVHGWYSLPRNASYYEGAYGCNGLCSYPQNSASYVLDLAAAADGDGIDWGQYDNDGPDGVPNSGDDDGYVDVLVVVHSGQGGECGGNNFIWSHSFFLRGWGLQPFTTSTNRTGGGKIKIDDYIIQPEQSCWDGMIEIGVFCHEYGHALGLPDLYDTSGQGAGIGRWGVMAGGGWGGDGTSPSTPVQMSAWSKIYLGWVEPTVVPCDGIYELPAVALAPSVLKIWSQGAPDSEYFLIENRQKTLNDERLPQAGLNIWHIDEDIIAAAWYVNEINAGPTYGVALEQADGLDDLHAGANSGDTGDPWPGSQDRTSFGNGTQPATKSNGGATTAVDISGISAPGMTMSARIEVGIAELDVTAPDVALTSPLGGENWAVGGSEAITWQATDDIGVTAVALRLSRDGGTTFPEVLAADLPNSGSWSWQIPLNPGDDLVLEVVARDAAGNESADANPTSFAVTDQYAPGVVLLCPEGGEFWAPHSLQTIAWAAADNIGVTAVDIFMSEDGGQSWPDTVAVALANDGIFQWQVPARSSLECRLRLRVRDAAGQTAVVQSEIFTVANTTGFDDAPSSGQKLSVGPCVPNPFNPLTTVHYYNPREGLVAITVYDLLGRRIKCLLEDHRPAGPGTIRWNGADDSGRSVASGIYYIQAAAAGQRSIHRATLIR